MPAQRCSLVQKEQAVGGRARCADGNEAAACVSIVSFNSVLDAAGKARQLQIAFDLLQQVKLEGLTPDTVTYTSLVDACGKAQHVERAFQILPQMQEVRCRSHPRAPLSYLATDRPNASSNTHTYNALIDACGKSASWSAPSWSRGDAAQRGADDMLHSALVDACARAGSLIALSTSLA